MADVSKISANGIDYNVKDANARSNISTMQSTLNNAVADISELKTKVRDLYVIPLTGINFTQGESQRAKVMRAVNDGVIPVGRPFVGVISSGAKYFTAGYLYAAGDSLYGFILWGGYFTCRAYTVNAGTYTETVIV